MKKVLGYLVMVCCFSVAKGQDEEPGATGQTLERVIKILKQKGVTVVVDKRNLKLAEPVRVPIQPFNDSLLPRIFAEQPYLKYEFIANRLAISRKSKEEIESARDHFVFRTRGIVLSDSSQPLPLASVQLRPGGGGIMTNSLGNFSVDWSIGDTIEISHISYKTIRIPWRSSRRTLIVHMELENPNMDVAIVRGYSTKEKSNTAGVAQVKLNGVPTGDVLKIIQENISGVFAPPTSGLAGATHKFQFRGPTSLGAISDLGYRPSSSPLFVVNGIPWAPLLRPVNQLTTMVGEPQAPGVSAVGFDPFFTINPLDIETITLLKDAEATSMYGARGANGVILITTKKGTSKEPRLTVSASYGIGRSLPAMPLMNTEQYLEMRREAFANDNSTITATNAPDLVLWDQNRYLDLNKLLLGGTSNNLNEHFSFSQGDSLYQFMLNGGYGSQTATMPSDVFGKRWSLLSDFYYRSKNRKLKTGITASFAVAENKWLTENIMHATLLAPNVPELKDSEGNLVWEESGAHFRNPLSLLMLTDNIQTGNTSMHAYVQYKIRRKWRLESSVGYQEIRVHERSKEPMSAFDPDLNPKGTYSEAKNRFTTWIVEPSLNYTDSLWKSIRVEGVIGASWSAQINDWWNRIDTGYTNDQLLGIPSGANGSEYKSDRSKYLFLSTFGRLRFNYKDKYFLSLTVRRDGSSRFGPEQRYANFGAIGAGYIFWQKQNDEGKNSYAKLRASYGTTGNDQIGDYAYLNTWSKAARQYQGITGILPEGLANPYYQWEVTRKLEAGVELRLNDNFSATVIGYRNRSKNQVINYSLPTQAGFGNVVQNFPAIIQNTGLEVDAVFKKTWGKFMWCSKATLAVPQNKLIRFDDLENSTYANKIMIGKPLNILIVRHFSGVDPNTGLFTIADPDEKIAAKLDPDLFGGIRNIFHYKQFQLDTYFEFRRQKAPHYLTYLYNYNPPGATNKDFFNNQPIDLVNRWRQTGDEAGWQKVSTSTASTHPVKNAINNWVNSDEMLVKASYLRLKNVQLGYTFSDKFCKKKYIKGTNVYISAENLFTITPFKGVDPELLVPFSLPLQRTVTIGLQVTL
jgi:TonB-linked SusC/RagA family outer membrane protein